MKAVIFDFNGVIMDDEHLHCASFIEVFAEDGMTVDEATYYARYLGLDDRGCTEKVLADHGRTAEVWPIVERKAVIYMRMIADGFRVFDGAPELVRACAARAPIAIASGARRNEIEVVLERADLRACFGAIVSADEMKRGKPDPEGYLAAAAALGIDPAECTVIEDAPNGIEAAHRAGMRCFAVATSRDAAQLGDADRIFASVAEISVDALLG